MKMAEMIAGFTGIKAFQEALTFARDARSITDAEVVLVHAKDGWHVAIVHPGQEAF